MKQRRILSLAIASAMAFGGTAMIASADPGPNGNNDKGLCTAYFNGQKKGHDENRPNGNGNGNGNENGRQSGESPAPFAGLEEAAANAGEDGMSIFDYCMEEGIGIGGNPGHNGRFTECFDEEAEDGNPACPADDD